ncbi:MAG: PilT/PilU family type 4a pilus ATPase, partial [Planctomycetota bacterium]
MEILELLTFAKKEKASDVHISSGEPPMIRIHGDMRKIDSPSLQKEDVHKILYDILNDQQRKIFEENHELDFAIAFGDAGRFRVNAFLQSRGESIVFRTIPTVIPSLEELGMPKIVEDLTKKEKGLILVTGPTGCGKSTTLAAMIDLINRKEKCHILTVEDPIEFVHNSKNCLINQRELGHHTHSFANALRSALREDPDVILVGEMRDLETISLALTAAETGHLVFGTLHTSSAPKTVDRIIDVFPPEQQGQVRSMFS